MDRLLLIDGHSVAYRAFFALPVENFSTTTGQHTNAVFGFTSMLINVLRDEQPTHVAVAFDVSRQTFRTTEYAEYKGNRSKSPAEFTGQISLIKDVLQALGIPAFEKEGFEADDIIGTLTTQAKAAGMEVLICSGDRDAFQLVTDTTTILYPRKGVSDLVRMTPVAVEEKYGVTPEHYPDLAALVGETSDNLPGVPGVGPKTAAKWINGYGTLDALVADVENIPGKAGESLRDHLDDVLRNRRINALVCDLDLPAGPAELGFSTEWNRDAIHEVFDALEFSALRERLFDYLGGGDESVTAEAAVDVQTTVVASGGLAAWLKEHADGTPMGLEVTGVTAPVGARAEGLAIATASGPAAWVSVEGLDPSDDTALAAWLADPAQPKVLHDAKGQAHALAAQGWPVAGVAADTALATYLVKPDQRAYDLADLSVRYLHRELVSSGDDSGQLSFDDDGGADVAVQRARAALDLWAVLEPELESLASLDLLRDVELPLVDVLLRMEAVGVAIDTDHLDTLHAEFTDRMLAAAQDAYDVIGKEVNLGSPKQLQVVLFDELGMPKTKRTKTGYTTDAESLQSLFAKTEHPFLQHLLAHRDVTRLRQTVEGLQKTVAPDGRIHTTYFQTIAATGRLSSADPNLQNIPIRTESGRRIREAFTVGDGFETLLTADYSQIEMRIMAHLSEDADLIEAFRSGHDFHTVMAAKVFERDPSDIDGGLRARIKAMNYGLAYGLSSYGLSQQLGISTSEAQALMDDYFETFGGVRDYLRGLVDEARSTGFTATILGRRRYLPDLLSDNRQRREMAERMALNAPIQGSAADIIKVAMLGVDRALRESGMASRMLLQVHDELVLEVAPGERDALEALVREQMAGAADLSVPLDVSVGVGPTWHDAGH
ncbi:DNA polymerase I [Aeromicrobium terrae]|uniref:DNA polymerase I n=1 Tax=Aeromicrobium terrae TaxID=2498846 RepID=A0A5C8NR40_9ACTN|nr:DNA polymerase I [Aeromicrobium terrae]TXL62883.1 DNA polymerase I [Aeromicrobium terrae]